VYSLKELGHRTQHHSRALMTAEHPYLGRSSVGVGTRLLARETVSGPFRRHGTTSTTAG